ncbi:MAG: FIST C-terminal domain-containing protein [Treponema sp.]|nr:FIST C-terminal domain-containing protein [Treponema sp.]
MIKCAGLYTCEIDDPELALSQIQAQLSEKIELMEHTIGVVMCHTEAMESGVLRHIAENLPFDVAGTTTTAQSVNGVISEMGLTIFVITSDTVQFRVGMTESLEAEIEGPLRAEIERVGDGSATPRLVLAFPPLMLQSSGDDILEIWGRILPGVPIFGTLAVDDSSDFTNGRVICRNETAKTSHAFVLCYGDIDPRFFIATLPKENEMRHKGVITKANANVVYEIDGRKAHEYLKDVGLAVEGVSKPIWFMPFQISQRKRSDYDGVPVLRGMASITEEGAVIFRGKVDENASFTLMNMAAEDVVTETEAKLRTVKDMPGNDTNMNGILIFSCVVRHMLIIHKNPLEEMERANEAIKEALGDPPFMMSYSGGEFCPTSVKDGVHVNRFHNYSIVGLVI